MFSPIKGLKIKDDNCYHFKGKASDTLDFLSKINIFVGENNSGKSRLMRSFLASDLKYIPEGYDLDILNQFVKNLKQDIDSYLKNNGISDNDLSIQDIHEIEQITYIDSLFELPSRLDILMSKIIKLPDNKGPSGFIGTSRGNKKYSEISNDLIDILERNLSNLSIYKDGKTFKDILEIPSFLRIYIPILRGIRPINYEISSNSRIFTKVDVYRSRTRDDYFHGEENGFKIFSGLNSYTQIKSYLLGNLQKRKLIKDYEDYLSKNFFYNKPVVLIPSEENDTLIIKIGDEIEMPIHNLGDGIQSIIILTLPMFLHKGEHALFFIEEPEKLLHPGLQRKLIDTFLNEDGYENYQFFMTTHSNHFLDITFDFPNISIYALRKKLKYESENKEEKIPEFYIENLSYGDTSSLELLGVRNSSVFLSNCTIWVEGITDRLYFKHYLELYKKYLYDKYLKCPEKTEYFEFKEDFHYSFVEYGGGNITHWSFLDNEETDNTINVDRLCSRLFLIVDKDEGKEKRHQALKKKLGDKFYSLEAREVENLISKKVLLAVIKEYEGEDPDIQDFNEWDYRDEPLGKFIEKKLNKKKRKGSYSADSGTISSKYQFCKKAIKYTKQWEDLSNETMSICEKIYKFIKENNK